MGYDSENWILRFVCPKCKELSENGSINQRQYTKEHIALDVDEKYGISTDYVDTDYGDSDTLGSNLDCECNLEDININDYAIAVKEDMIKYSESDEGEAIKKLFKVKTDNEVLGIIKKKLVKIMMVNK